MPHASLDTLLFQHGVCHGQILTSTEIQQQLSGSDRGGCIDPDSERPVTNPKAQGRDPLVYWGEFKYGMLSSEAISTPPSANRRSLQATPEKWRSPLRRSVPNPRLCVEVSPTTSHPAVGNLYDSKSHLDPFSTKKQQQKNKFIWCFYFFVIFFFYV